MFDNYPRLAIFIGFILITMQAVYATVAGTWLILQFGFPVTSAFLIFVIGFVFLGFIFKVGIEILSTIFTLLLMFKA